MRRMVRALVLLAVAVALALTMELAGWLVH